ALANVESRLQASLQSNVFQTTTDMSATFQQAHSELAERMDARVAAVEDHLHAAEVRLSEGGGWDREPDSADVSILSKVAGSKEAVDAALAPLLSDAALGPDTTTLEGELVAQRYLLRCSGAAELAARRIDKLLQHRRVGPREWRSIPAQAPDGSQVVLSLGRDRNRKQVAAELALKKIKMALMVAIASGLFVE
ncbi:unnamed protein product, partial [Prorocentrum cordatum]